jgi:hypothetical protein
LEVVRLVLRELMALWKDPTQPLSPEEARRQATVIFSGARTVAHLLSQQAKQGGTAADWLDRVLEEMDSEHALDL